MEESLLNMLEFNLALPTVLDFFNVYQELMLPMVGSSEGSDGDEVKTALGRVSSPLNDETKFLAQYFCELTLQRYCFAHRFKPSLVAACAISLALYRTEARIGQPMGEDNPLVYDDTGRFYWPRALQKVSGFVWSDLAECMHELFEEYKQPKGENDNLTMIKKRYERADKLQVASSLAAPPHFEPPL
jgi:hypothetical protein